ncbi:MAG: SDR family NAD(P)-dependent oxidoreductase, partial [Bacteroidales bacterium]|nr:SDR family NAD(P)-dependent oxidoreductase [Bacteroidales bacterium]
MQTKANPLKPIVLITGATSGIGRASAIRLAKDGFPLILTGRRAVTLKKLITYLESKYGAACVDLSVDVRDYASVERALNELPEEWKPIGVLINNAGLAAGLDPVHEGSLDDWNQMIDTNIKGILHMTRLIAPGMIARKKGHIINIGSIAGKEVYPKGAVYCATKHAVEALTMGMRQDFVNFGVKVSSVCPGAVETEFSVVRFKGDQDRADKVYEGFTPLRPEDVADVIHFILTRPSHVNIQDVLIMPAAQ